MKTNIHSRFAGSPAIDEAEAILRSCVHCGFCNATCPTYLETGDERDGPRGRIYLLKQLLESGGATEATRRHLDRCLGCKSCETTCPSGVAYGRLADIGREMLESEVRRPFMQRMLRSLLLLIFPYRRRIRPLLYLGQSFRPLLPPRLKRLVPARQALKPSVPARHERRMILLGGCVQAAATPNTNRAAVRIFDRLGIGVTEVKGAGCCGAMSYHLAACDAGLDFARRNIDAWWPEVEAGAEAVLVTASGCGAMVKDYGRLLADDAIYAAKAARVSELARDPGEILVNEELDVLNLSPPAGDTAVHCPCSLQHAQRLSGVLDALFDRLGVKRTTVRDQHLCCGSAGTYSILQPELSDKLLMNKLHALQEAGPERIVTANIGCQMHLASRSQVPVEHWLEMLDDAMGESGAE